MAAVKTPVVPPVKATRREWIGLGVIALPCMVYAMDLTVLNLALPAISAELKPSAAQLLWIVDIYGFLVAGFLITMGTLGDRIGRRKLLLAGAAAFGAASLVAAWSNSAEMLIAMRALLGVAGATLAPSTMSLIRNMFHDEHERQFAIGVWIASFSAGAVIGPLVGGALLQVYPWGSVFLVAVPVMALLLLLGPALLPEYRDPNAGRLDPASVALSLLAVLTTIYGLKQIAEHGLALASATRWEPGSSLACCSCAGRAARLPAARSLAVSPATVQRCHCRLRPVVPGHVRRLHLHHAVSAAGARPVAAARRAGDGSLVGRFVVGSLLAPRLARRVPAVTLLVWGLAAGALGFAMLAGVDGRHGLWLLIAGTVVMSLGLSPVFTIGNEMIITAAPPERAGAASALSETVSEFGGALGIAVFGSLGTALYRHALGGAMPEGVAPEAATDALATLGAAAATAAALPEPIGAALFAAATAAFVDALQVAAIACAAVVATACIVTARILRT